MNPVFMTCVVIGGNAVIVNHLLTGVMAHH